MKKLLYSFAIALIMTGCNFNSGPKGKTDHTLTVAMINTGYVPSAMKAINAHRDSVGAYPITAMTVISDTLKFDSAQVQYHFMKLLITSNETVDTVKMGLKAPYGDTWVGWYGGGVWMWCECNNGTGICEMDWTNHMFHCTIVPMEGCGLLVGCKLMASYAHYGGPGAN